MSKRLHVLAGFVLSLLTLAPAASHAQAGAKVTMEWQNATLSRVAQAFAAFSGRTIIVALDVGEPEVTASVRNVDWQRALDIILLRYSLVARVDASGVIHIEKQRPAPAKG